MLFRILGSTFFSAFSNSTSYVSSLSSEAWSATFSSSCSTWILLASCQAFKLRSTLFSSAHKFAISMYMSRSFASCRILSLLAISCWLDIAPEPEGASTAAESTPDLPWAKILRTESYASLASFLDDCESDTPWNVNVRCVWIEARETSASTVWGCLRRRLSSV